MSEGPDFGRWLIRFIKEDLRIIFTYLFVLLLIISGFAMMMGFLSIESTSFRTPSVNFVNKQGLSDFDGDTLPDIIEGTPSEPCERGERIYRANGDFVGLCTDTDHRDIDSDNDLYTDGVEDAIGTNPTNFWSPGFIYIIVLIYAAIFIFFRVYEGDPLKEYKEFEMKQSSGVSGKGGKYAFGGSVFGDKSADEVSDEERKQAIQQDARFQRMVAEGEEAEQPKFKKKRNYSAIALQLSIALIIAIMLFLFARNA